MMIITGPTKPTKKPPNLKSDCSMIPVLYAMALGGVDTGSSNAQDALKPMIIGNTAGCSTDDMPINDIATGIRIVVAAVLLIKLEKVTVIKLNKQTKT